MSWIDHGMKCDTCGKIQLVEENTPSKVKHAILSASGWKNVFDAGGHTTGKHRCIRCDITLNTLV